MQHMDISAMYMPAHMIGQRDQNSNPETPSIESSAKWLPRPVSLITTLCMLTLMLDLYRLITVGQNSSVDTKN